MFFQALSYYTCENVFFDKGPSELMAQRPQGDRRARSLKVKYWHRRGVFGDSGAPFWRAFWNSDDGDELSFY